MRDILDRLEQAVMLEGEDAAIRIRGTYIPQAGPEAKVFPPTYIQNADGDRYHFEQRWDSNGNPVEVVILDSVQSQAARAEVALVAERERLGLPVIVTEVSVVDDDTGEERRFTITNLDAPHRSRDAYLLDSELDGTKFDDTDVGKALLASSAVDASGFLRYAPTDLVFGVWDSHRGKRIPTKFARAYTSEMVGWSYLRGRKAATKTDPAVLKGDSEVALDVWRPDLETSNKKNPKERLSELGYGMIPVAAERSVGGVHVKEITRLAVLSLTSFARYRFGGSETLDRAGRTALAALGLLADRLAFSAAGMHLRSGSDLVKESETLEWVRAGNATEDFELSRADALSLFDLAKERLDEAGVTWDPDPIVLRPAAHLAEAIEQTYLERTIEGEE